MRLVFSIPPEAGRGQDALKHPNPDLIPTTELLPRGEKLAQSGHRNNDSHNIEIFLI